MGFKRSKEIFDAIKFTYWPEKKIQFQSIEVFNYQKLYKRKKKESYSKKYFNPLTQ